VACGGGGGGGSVFGGDWVLTVKGTAATGAAINGGAVTATCKTGTGTATSNSEGSFTVTITNGVGPCLVTITPVGSTTPLYSITSGSGATQTANIPQSTKK
jgi:hypothetical protein